MTWWYWLTNRSHQYLICYTVCIVNNVGSDQSKSIYLDYYCCPKLFMVFRKAIFVLRVLVNQDKKFMDPSALLSSWFTRQTGFFCSEISPLSAVFCTYIQECWRKEFVIVLIHKVRPRALENWLYWNRLGLLGTHWFLQVKDVYSRLFVVE